MTFLNPILLSVALACVVVPIIIHILMRRRRRPVQWGAMKFLLEAYRQQRRRLNLEQLLLLAARCLLVGLLALAVGKPVLGAAGLLGVRLPRTLYLVVDNSLASQAAGDDAKGALPRHRTKAAGALAGLEPAAGDKAALLTIGGPAEALVAPPTSEIASIDQLIRDLPPTESRGDLAGALAKVRDDIAGNAKGGESQRLVQVLILSEFRGGSIDLDTPGVPLASGDEASRVRVLAPPPAVSPLTNVSIAGVETLQGVVVAPAPGSTQGASVLATIRLARSGNAGEALATKVRARAVALDQAPNLPEAKPTDALVRWKPGEESATVSVSLEVPPALSKLPLGVRVEIDRDAIDADNAFVLPLPTRDRLSVALLAPPRSSGAPSTIDRFTPADWYGLALAPQDLGTLRTRRASDVALRSVDPARDLAGTGASALAGFDVVVIPEPQLLDAGAWRRVRAALDAGAVAVVSPPPGETVHVWADAMESALSLGWTIAREPRTYTTPQRLGSSQSIDPLLAAIAGELAELIKPVGVSKVLPVQAKSSQARVLLALADGTPLVLAGSPGQGDAAAKASERGLVVLLASAPDLSWTDLPAKPLMLPMLQEIVRQGVASAAGSRSGLAGGLAPVASGTSELARLAPEGSRGDDRLVPDATGRFPPMRRSGVWLARSASGLGLGPIAINADPAGGNIETRSREEIAKWLGVGGTRVEFIEADPAAAAAGPGKALGAPDETPPPISLPLLIAAGVIALAELLMARFFSHAKAEDAAATASAPATGRAAA